MSTEATYLNSLKVLKLISSILIKNVKTPLFGNMYSHIHNSFSIEFDFIGFKKCKTLTIGWVTKYVYSFRNV